MNGREKEPDDHPKKKIVVDKPQVSIRGDEKEERGKPDFAYRKAHQSSR